jgi:hypothetical protein
MTLRRALLDLVLLSAVLAAVACDCPPLLDPAPPGVRMHGPAPAGAGEILASALARWPSLRGEIDWVDPGESRVSCGEVVGGCTYRRPECGDFAAVVERREPVTGSALAHELCHAAGLAEPEVPACRDALNEGSR